MAQRPMTLLFLDVLQAPEVLLGKRCTEKVDIYSYGVIL